MKLHEYFDVSYSDAICEAQYAIDHHQDITALHKAKLVIEIFIALNEGLENEVNKCKASLAIINYLIQKPDKGPEA